MRGFAPDDIDALLPRLQELGLVDDRRTARLLVEREVAARRAGPALIRAKLAAKGVAPGVADECLGALTHDWELDQARTAAQRWAARHRKEGAWQAALIRHLRARGFSWDAVRRAVESSGSDPDDWRLMPHDEP
jgi:regulatory protein